MTTLGMALLGDTRAEIRALLEKSLAGGEITWEEGVTLSGVRGRELHALTAVWVQARSQLSAEPLTVSVVQASWSSQPSVQGSQSSPGSRISTLVRGVNSATCSANSRAGAWRSSTFIISRS